MNVTDSKITKAPAGTAGVSTGTDAFVGECKSLSLSEIEIVPDLQIRVWTPSGDLISTYAKELEAGDEFPPVDVFWDGTTYLLANGFQRYGAHEKIKRTKILARIHSGGMREALLFAIRADMHYGLRRTRKDKHHAFELLWADSEWRSWGYETIANGLNVSSRSVSNWARKLTPQIAEIPTEKKCVRNGKEYTVDTSSIGNRQNVPNAITQPTAVPDDTSKIKSQVVTKTDNQNTPPPAVDNMIANNLNTVVPSKALDKPIELPTQQRRVSKLEQQITGATDELDALLAKEVRTFDKEFIAAVADLHRVATRFLEKYDSK